MGDANENNNATSYRAHTHRMAIQSMFVFIPANPEEAFYLSVNAFDLEQLQNIVFVLSDLDIGMNDWMIKDLEWDDKYRT